jgi:hypothetical protein
MNKFKSFTPLMAKDEYQFIEKYLNKDDILLEWGCGNSTIYYSGLVKKLISIEHDIDYFNFIKNAINAYNIDNIEQIHIPAHYPQPNPSRYEQFKDYIEYPSKNNLKFTKVLIDGRGRIYCAFSIVNMLNENVIVMIHDFNREEYQYVLDYYDIVDRITHTRQGIVALKKKTDAIFDIIDIKNIPNTDDYYA